MCAVPSYAGFRYVKDSDDGFGHIDAICPSKLTHFVTFPHVLSVSDLQGVHGVRS